MRSTTVVFAMLLSVAGAVWGAPAAGTQTLTWKIGGWDVTYRGDQFEKHYELTATARPEGKAPLMWLRCSDGRFTIEFPYAFPDPPYPYAMILLFEDGKTQAFHARPNMSGTVTLDAARAEYQLSNARRIGVRFKVPGGENRDFFYKLDNLAVGKPQLFNVCPIPHR